jgi:hypothetical protein
MASRNSKRADRSRKPLPTSGEITVCVITVKDRPNLYMRYRDPISGRSEVKSAGMRNRREAEKVAAKWEADLGAGRYSQGAKISWQDFRERYEDEKLASLADTDTRLRRTVLCRARE